jgi:cupin superfamily acireductone dioxygenase involved in methionine salvage
MSKQIALAFLILGISTSVFAGDNSQATLGDVKEALHKLIIQDKANAEKFKSLDIKTQEMDTVSVQANERINTLEFSSKEAINIANKKDKLDLYVDNFVAKNEHMLLITTQN